MASDFLTAKSTPKSDDQNILSTILLWSIWGEVAKPVGVRSSYTRIRIASPAWSRVLFRTDLITGVDGNGNHPLKEYQ
jgi:hypothetical protein